jgi:hypothetical protein
VSKLRISTTRLFMRFSPNPRRGVFFICEQIADLNHEIFSFFSSVYTLPKRNIYIPKINIYNR